MSDKVSFSARFQTEMVLATSEVVELRDRYVRLVATLNHIEKNRPASSSDIDACFDAIVALKRFLEADPIIKNSEITKRIGKLAAALRNVTLGVKPELFARPKGSPKHRTAGKSETVALQAIAAAALELMVRRGMDIDDAAQFISYRLELKKITHSAKRTPIRPNTIKGWRYEMGGANPSESVAIFNQQIAELDTKLPANASQKSIKLLVIGCIEGLIGEGLF